MSFKDNINKKTTNPFLGTYFVVLIWRNWELLYSLFNFDQKTTLSQKILYITTYLESKNVLKELGINVLYAFAVIIVTYILINVSRLIINFFEKKVTPNVYRLTDKSSIVTKERYDQLNTNYTELEKKLESERELRIKSQREIEELETKLGEAKLNSKKTEIQPRQYDPMTDDPNMNMSARMFADKIMGKDLAKQYILTSTKLKNNNSWLPNKDITSEFNEFLNLGLYEKTNETEGEKQFTLTKDAEDVLKILRLESN